MSRSADRIWRDTRGAAAVEFSLVIGLIIMLVIGTVEVGRALMARSDVSHALSQAVRVVHLDPGTTREQIVERLETLLDGYQATDLDVEVRQIAGTTYMEIAVRFPFDVSIPLVPAQRLNMQVSTLAPMVSPLQAEGR